MPGARPWSPSSPSSAAPPASTAPRAPTMAPRRSRCLPAARSRAAASSPTGRGSSPANLHEGRDLKPTTDLRAVLKGVLRDHLRVDDAVLASKVFPGQRRGEADGGIAAGVGWQRRENKSPLTTRALRAVPTRGVQHGSATRGHGARWRASFGGPVSRLCPRTARLRGTPWRICRDRSPRGRRPPNR